MSIMLKESNLAPIAPPRFKRRKKPLPLPLPKINKGYGYVRIASRVGKKIASGQESDDDDRGELSA